MQTQPQQNDNDGTHPQEDERRPIIFLDIDGVLNTTKHNTQIHFEPHLMKRLKQIIEMTDGIIVLTTFWRHFHEYITYVLHRHGIDVGRHTLPLPMGATRGKQCTKKFLHSHLKKQQENGYCCQQQHESRTSNGPMVFIAHRGNIDGPNPAEENKPEYLLRALSNGFDVELDAWLDPTTGQWALGHDGPVYPVNYDFLLTPGFWIHSKNGAALQAMVQDPRIHCFSHDKDDYTLTSRGFIWAYPDVTLAGTNCIAVMYSNPERILDQDIGGICHDIVGPLRDQYIASRKLAVGKPGSINDEMDNGNMIGRSAEDEGEYSSRAEEIEAWLKMYGEQYLGSGSNDGTTTDNKNLNQEYKFHPTDWKYVILDDRPTAAKPDTPLFDRFVFTETKLGLTEEDTEKAIKLLLFGP